MDYMYRTYRTTCLLCLEALGVRKVSKTSEMQFFSRFILTFRSVRMAELLVLPTYHIYLIYSDRQAWANSIDPDETPQNAASHLGLHCLPLIQQFLDTTSRSELYWLKF